MSLGETIFILIYQQNKCEIVTPLHFPPTILPPIHQLSPCSTQPFSPSLPSPCLANILDPPYTHSHASPTPKPQPATTSAPPPPPPPIPPSILIILT